MPENARPFNWLPQVTFDPETGSISVLLREGASVHTVQVHADDDLAEYVYVHLNATGHIVGVEIL